MQRKVGSLWANKDSNVVSADGCRLCKINPERKILYKDDFWNTWGIKCEPDKKLHFIIAYKSHTDIRQVQQISFVELFSIIDKLRNDFKIEEGGVFFEFGDDRGHFHVDVICPCENGLVRPHVKLPEDDKKRLKKTF